MKIAYDCTLKRPGCALLQAALGGDTRLANLFPTETWLLAPTPHLAVYPVDEEQLEKLVEITEKARETGEDNAHRS